MRYIPNTDADRQAMLEAMGLTAIEDLFSGIPDGPPLARVRSTSRRRSAEQEVLQHMRRLAGR